MEEEITNKVLIFGFMIAAVMGFVGNRTHFCTMGAVADWINVGDTNRLRAWLFTIALAVLGVSLLEFQQWIILEGTHPPYRMASLPWLRFILGGLMFGIGMTLASGCGNKTLIRIGGGNLKSIFVFLVCGFFAYLMTQTVFYEVIFDSWLSPWTVNFSLFGYGNQTLGELIFGPAGFSGNNFFLGTLFALALGIWVFYSSDFRTQYSLIFSSAVMGLGVVGGWYVTSGPMGRSWQEAAQWMDQPPLGVGAQSFTFINPMGESLVYLQSGFNGLLLSFGVCATAGVVAGSFLSALVYRTFHFEWFPSLKDFINHMIGAALMGIGGVLGMGCTIGQAITGTSTMSAGSITVFISILFGSSVTMKTRYYLLFYEDEANLPKALLASLVDFRILPKSFRRLDPI
mgnify:FL=1